MSPPGRPGLVIGARLQARGLAGVLEAVVAAAATTGGSGLRSVFTVEGRGMEAFGLLSAVAPRAPGRDLGTGVVPTPLRPPTLAAMGAATVQAMVPDATVWLGVGTSTPAIAGTWHSSTYGPSPLGRLEEYLEVARRALTGETVRFQGRHYTVDGFVLEPSLVGPRRPALAVGALGPATMALAGRLADAVVLNAVPASKAAEVAERAAEAGNRVAYCFVHAAVDGGGAGLDEARRSLAAEISAQAYARRFSQAGYGAVVAQVRALRESGDRVGARSAVPDEMCRDYYCFGAEPEVSAFVAAYRSAGLVPLVMPEVAPERPAGEVVATLRAAAAGCAPEA